MSLLEVKNLGISFGGLRAVDGFHISIEKGQLYGLIGQTVPEKRPYLICSPVYIHRMTDQSR